LKTERPETELLPSEEEDYGIGQTEVLPSETRDCKVVLPGDVSQLVHFTQLMSQRTYSG